jgi:hypothetical protein
MFRTFTTVPLLVLAHTNTELKAQAAPLAEARAQLDALLIEREEIRHGAAYTAYKKSHQIEEVFKKNNPDEKLLSAACQKQISDIYKEEKLNVIENINHIDQRIADTKKQIQTALDNITVLHKKIAAQHQARAKSNAAEPKPEINDADKARLALNVLNDLGM